MLTTGIELEELADNLRLKRMLLHDLASETYNRSADIKALREKIQKEISTAAKAARKE